MSDLDIFDCMVLGKLISNLEACDGEGTARFDFCYFSPGSFHSYRGFYEYLAISPEQTDTTVSDFLKSCKDAVGKTFTGWKGGNYRMGRDTRVWVDDPSNVSSTGIVGVKDLGHGLVIIQTAHIDT